MNEIYKTITIFDNQKVNLIGHTAVIGIPKTLYIEDVIFNPPATVVFWSDGSKTVVKCGDGEEFDPEKGVAMAIVKRVFGNKGNYNNVIHEWTTPYIEAKVTERLAAEREKFVRDLNAFHERMKQREESEEKDGKDSVL